MNSKIQKLALHFRREMSRKFLSEVAAQHLRTRPQLAFFAFDLISIEIMVNGRYDDAQLAYLEKLLGPRLSDNIVLDVGANIGNHAVAFADVAKKVIAFEPHPRTVQLLRFNTAHLSNVEIIEKGASDSRGALPAISPIANFGASSITNRAPGPGEFSWICNVDRLDELLANERGKRIGMIKIDVEGHEPNVIRGARKILEANHPIVLFEQNIDAVTNGSSESFDLLRDMGYRFFYSLKVNTVWATPQALPSLLRKVFRIVEGVTKGPPDETVVLEPVTMLEVRDYNTLIASFESLN